LYTVATIGGSVYVQGATTAAAAGATGTVSPNSGESLPDLSTVPAAAAVISSPVTGVLLKDLGREIVVYYNNAASGTITSPYSKIAIWREVALIYSSGTLGTTGWIKVWSATNTAVAPVARSVV